MPSNIVLSGSGLIFSTVRIDHAARMVLKEPDPGEAASLHKLAIVGAAETTVRICYDDDGEGANEVALTGDMSFAVNGGMLDPFERDIDGCLQAPVGKFLTLIPSAAVDGWAIVAVEHE